MSLETIVRPFSNQGVDPQPFHPAGQIGVPLITLRVGQHGGSKTFAWSASWTIGRYMIRIHKEKASVSLEKPS